MLLVIPHVDEWPWDELPTIDGEKGLVMLTHNHESLNDYMSYYWLVTVENDDTGLISDALRDSCYQWLRMPTFD